MTDPLSAYIHRTWLTDADGAQTEGVNKVAIYYWDTNSLSWVKATGGAIPGANVSVTNFPIGQKVMAASMPVVLASDQSTVSTANGTTLPTDKTLLTKSIVTGASTLVGNPFTDVKVTPDGGICTNQNILVNTGCSSTANLTVGETFTGVVDLNIFASGIQVILDADQNCTVFVDQGGDGVNWDVTDSYDYFANTKSFGITVMCVGVFYRVRVTNIGIATTTSFRLQTISVPFVSPLPRSLNSNGDFRVAVDSMADHYGVQQYLAPNGEVTAVPLYKLVGDVFFNGVIDSGIWSITLVGTGNAVASGGQLVMTTGVTANSSAHVNSVHVARFAGLAPNKCRIPLQCPDGGTANNTRRWGVGTATDRAYFELTGTTLSCYTLKGGVSTLRATAGTLNGQWGKTFTIGANSHFFEIIYQPRQVVWIADNKIVHTHNAAADAWTESLHLPLFFENFNFSGSTTNVTMQVRLGVIARFGIPQTQVDGFWQSGTTAGVQIKLGPGSVWGIAMSGVTNNANVTLHDGTSVAAPVIYSTGAMGALTTPIYAPLYGEAFNDGLFLVISGAAANAKVSFD